VSSAVHDAVLSYERNGLISIHGRNEYRKIDGFSWNREFSWNYVKYRNNLLIICTFSQHISIFERTAYYKDDFAGAKYAAGLAY